jgi:hypothetical protein
MAELIGDRRIEIEQFVLLYDGCFVVEFKYNDRKYIKPVYLKPAELFKVLEHEGLDSFEKIDAIDFYSDGLIVSKTSLIFEVFDVEDETISFITSEEAEHYQENDIQFVFCEIKVE